MSEPDIILINAGPYEFLARFETAAPKTIATFRKLLPYQQKLIHVRWSGEGMWIPLGDTNFGLGFENHTSHPSAGQILLYPGGYSETELLFCYGGVAFASKMGPLAANHFLTIVEGNENLRPLGELVLWEGAQDVLFVAADENTCVNVSHPLFVSPMLGTLSVPFPANGNSIDRFRRRNDSKPQSAKL